MKLGQTSFVYFVSKISASIIGFVATVYFARLLGAETLGIYFLAVAVVVWLKLGGTLGLTSALVKRLSEGEDGGEHLAAAAAMSAALFAVTAVVLLSFRSHVDRYVGAEVTPLVLSMFLAVLSLTFVQSALKGEHKVHLAGVLDPTDKTLRTIVQVAALSLGFGLVGLLVGYAVGTFLALLIGAVALSTRLKTPAKEHFRSIFDYAKYSWLGSVKSTSFNWVDVVVLGFFVPSALIGIYSIAWNVAAFLKVFSDSITSTLFPEISSVAHDGDSGEVANLVDEGLAFAGLMTIPGIFGAALMGDWVLLIYGQEFVDGHHVLVVLVMATMFYSYMKQFVVPLGAIDRPDLAFRVNALFVASNLLLNVAFVYSFGWVGAAYATALTALLATLYGYHHLKALVDFTVPKKEVGLQVLAASVMTGPVYLGERAVETHEMPVPDLVAAFFVITAGAAVYFTVYYTVSARFRDTVQRNVPSVAM